MSITVTTTVAVCTLPFTSVTVKVTLLAPTLAQLKLLKSKMRVAMAQLSVEPLSTIAAVMFAWPLAFKATVRFLASTIGFKVSRTVITATAWFVLPFTSVTVKVMLLAPTFEQLKFV